MKKKVITLFAATILLISTTFANNSTQPSAQIQNEFNSMFTKPTDVNWEVVSGLYKATFQQSGQYLTAFFYPDGKMESVSRNISVSALPLILQKTLQDKMEHSWISEGIEMSGPNGTEYYVTVENAATKTIYYASSTDWTIYKTIKK